MNRERVFFPGRAKESEATAFVLIGSQGDSTMDLCEVASGHIYCLLLKMVGSRSLRNVVYPYAQGNFVAKIL